MLKFQYLFTLMTGLILFMASHATEESTTNNGADAQTRYIVDRVYVSLRESPGENARSVVRSLRSGTRLRLLEESPEGYSLVQMESGEKGWIKDQYLQSEMTAELMLPELREQLAELSQKSDAGLLRELDKTRKENKKLTAEKDSLQKELDEIKHTSANAIKISSQSRELIEKNQILQSEVDSLEAVNAQLHDDQSMSFFIYGGLLVLATIVLISIYDGLKKKRSYGSEW